MLKSRNGTRRSLAWLLLVLGCLTGVGVLLAADDEGQDTWEPLRLLAGTWEADIDGKLGTGRGVRRYEFLLNDLYLLARHASVRLPQEKSPAGDYHRELKIYSFDEERGVIVLRDFNIEGFVLTYACEVSPRRFVCTTEHVENGPGWKARLTVEVRDPYRFGETFELAPPGKELEVYFTNSWTRIPDLAD